VRAPRGNAAHSRRQRDGRFTVLVAQTVGRGQRLFPAPVLVFGEQAELRFGGFERRHVHAQEAHLLPGLPVLTKQRTRLIENFGVDLRGALERVGARDGREIFVAQLQLNGAGVQFVLAQAAAHHLREAAPALASSVPASAVSSLYVCSWLMDLGSVSAPTSLSNQPPASSPRALPASARPHFRNGFRETLRRTGQDHRFCGCRARADSSPSPCRRREPCARRAVREKTRFLAGHHAQHAIRLGLIGRNFATRREVATPMEQLSRVASRMASCSECAARNGGPCRRSVPVMSR